jgi:hypothetical protein
MSAGPRRLLLAALAAFALPAGAQVRVAPLTAPLSAAPAATPFSPLNPTVPALSAPSLAPALTAVPLLAPPSAPSTLKVPSAVPVPVAAAAPALTRAAAASAPGPRGTVSPAALTSFWDAAAPSDGPAPVRAGPDSDDGPATPLNAFWSGFPYEVEDSAVSLSAADDADAGSAAPFLVLKNREHAAALDRAVALARETAAGRRAFDAAEKVLSASGRAIPVQVKDLGRNWGEYDYLNDRLRLHERLFEKGREAELAGTLAHELTHVVQHAAGLPSNALELEIEAHLLDLELMEELGLEPRPHTFAAQISEALKKSPQAFIEVLQMAVPGSPFLGESSFAAIADQLEEDLESAEMIKGPRGEKLAAVIFQDLKTLRSKKGRAAYRAFSERVLADLARRSAAAAAR